MKKLSVQSTEGTVLGSVTDMKVCKVQSLSSQALNKIKEREKVINKHNVLSEVI